MDSLFNKRLGTNLLALIVAAVGWQLAEPWHDPVFYTGLFALSGALTNWLAIHMLFEKVPGLYGSGVIPEHFEEFKRGIHELVMRSSSRPNTLIGCSPATNRASISPRCWNRWTSARPSIRW